MKSNWNSVSDYHWSSSSIIIIIDYHRLSSSIILFLDELLPPPVPAYSMLSCGTPNAYFYGFSSGGLFTLIHSYYNKFYNAKASEKKIVRDNSEIYASMEIRKRFDLAVSQALSILVSSFMNDVSLSSLSSSLTIIIIIIIHHYHWQSYYPLKWCLVKKASSGSKQVFYR